MFIIHVAYRFTKKKDNNVICHVCCRVVNAIHCMKSVQIGSFFWSVFSVLGLNTDQLKLRIWTLFTQWWLITYGCYRVNICVYIRNIFNVLLSFTTELSFVCNFIWKHIVFPPARLVKHQLQNNPNLMGLLCLKSCILKIVLIQRSILRT